MNVSERYGMPLDPPQHVLDATRGLHEHRLANKLWSSADDDRRRADVLVDGSYGRATGVARIGLWRSHQAFYGTFYGVFYGIPPPNRCLARKTGREVVWFLIPPAMEKCPEYYLGSFK